MKHRTGWREKRTPRERLRNSGFGGAKTTREVPYGWISNEDFIILSRLKQKTWKIWKLVGVKHWHWVRVLRSGNFRRSAWFQTLEHKLRVKCIVRAFSKNRYYLRKYEVSWWAESCLDHGTRQWANMSTTGRQHRRASTGCLGLDMGFFYKHPRSFRIA